MQSQYFKEYIKFPSSRILINKLINCIININIFNYNSFINRYRRIIIITPAIICLQFFDKVPFISTRGKRKPANSF